MPRSIAQIAWDIRRNWKRPYFGAVPYLDAMTSLGSIQEFYGADSARDIILYFLSNATAWRGDKARQIKAELKALLEEK